MERLNPRLPYRLFWKRILLVLVLLLLVVASTGPARAQDKAKFVYWGGLIFSDEANTLFANKVKEWGDKRGIAVEVVMSNQNETVQKVWAAIEAGTMPDARGLGVECALPLSRQTQLG